MRVLAAISMIFLAHEICLAQGEDSQTYERDLQVIAEMLEGGFDNANQSYFDGRGKRDVRHRRLHVDVNRIQAANLGEYVFVASGYWDSDESMDAADQLWVLSADDESASVRMRVWSLVNTLRADAILDGDALENRPSCDLFWRREAAQFRATTENCAGDMPAAMVLSNKQLWMSLGEGEGNDYQMHRIRNFECYVDIPGVGGGRDIPYERYEGFRIHDQGGVIWFSHEDRRLSVSLFLVDWPINNYKGIFTRDSFVIYVAEEIDGEQKEHGYAFTVPEADRIGINLKWLLASCFMKSNEFATPFM